METPQYWHIRKTTWWVSQNILLRGVSKCRRLTCENNVLRNFRGNRKAAVEFSLVKILIQNRNDLFITGQSFGLGENWRQLMFHTFLLFLEKERENLSLWVLLKSSSAVSTSFMLISLYIIPQTRSQNLAQQIKNVFFCFFSHFTGNLCATSFVAGSSLYALAYRSCDHKTNLIVNQMAEQLSSISMSNTEVTWPPACGL